jgi:hypothetical protein
VLHAVDIYVIHFSQSILGMCQYGDNCGYWVVGGIVSSDECVVGDGVALISAVGVLFAVLREKEKAVVDFKE